MEAEQAGGPAAWERGSELDKEDGDKEKRDAEAKEVGQEDEFAI